MRGNDQSVFASDNWAEAVQTPRREKARIRWYLRRKVHMRKCYMLPSLYSSRCVNTRREAIP